MQATGPELSPIIENANATLMEIFGFNTVEHDRYKITAIYVRRNREVNTLEFLDDYATCRKKIDDAIKFIKERLAEEWISAASALDLVAMRYPRDVQTICRRAHAGLIKARAAHFIRDGRSTDNVDVPAEFWWAEGGAALDQNWTTGDFTTSIDDRRLQAFGVTFRRSDIERLRPAPTAATATKVVNDRQKMTAAEQKIFIGHGHSLVWRELKDFLEDRLYLIIEEFNRISAAGITTVDRLKQMLDNADFAFLILTAEDEQNDGKHHARLNVVHEAGLFQGRHGFKRAIILREETCDEFSNIHGLGQIPFPTGKISAVFEEIRRVLEREGLITSH
jgi:predicted nucleotide-binding protein